MLTGAEPAVEILLKRVSEVNDQRIVWLPAPLALWRAADAAAQSREVIQPALAAGVPVIVAGDVPVEALLANEPFPDLTARVVEVASSCVTEPVLVGSVRRGYRTMFLGNHGGHLLRNLFLAFLGASLAGLPVEH